MPFVSDFFFKFAALTVVVRLTSHQYGTLVILEVFDFLRVGRTLRENKLALPLFVVLNTTLVSSLLVGVYSSTTTVGRAAFGLLCIWR